MTEPEYVDPSKLHAGPIRQESLPDDLLELVRSAAEWPIRNRTCPIRPAPHVADPQAYFP